MTPEERDEKSATAAVHMATAHEGRPAILVDDDAKVLVMVERVKRIATAQGHSFTIDIKRVGTWLRFPNGGWVYVAGADKLIPPSERPN